MLKLAAIRQLSVPQDLSRRSGVWSWWPLVVGVLAVLAVLALAETVWLPRSMPREYVARKSLLVLPASDSPDVGEWTPGVLRLTSNPESAENELSDGVRVNTQCIEMSALQGHAVRGLLVSATVRGDEETVLSSTADAWARSFGEDVAQSYPFLTVLATETSGAAYGPCTGR